MATDVTAGRNGGSNSAMKKEAPTRKTRRQPGKPRTAKPHGPAAAVTAAQSPAPVLPAAAPPDKLTPEEQMERFAKELKNEDWGHQPC